MRRESKPAEAAAFALDRFLPYRLSVVTKRASRLFARRYSEAFGLSIPEWPVLAGLGRFGRLPGSEIAERTAMGKVKVSRAVRQLHDRGLLAREEDAADRRVHRLVMTPEGRQVHAGIVPLARGLEAELLVGLAAADLVALQALLDQLDRRLSEMGAEAAADGLD
ncbi:MarR family transcriptional regulator [Siccirubricoccus deserti]|uniref:MarR family winged helix-turn-helix transcriptional regulator n=1 Tax=Siccirubricoccus deserti TaxID=2013562 RepID=UPI00199F8654|nr:MarR family transcriptional regulator [Siccirubricoccus deserti]GGC51852.1 MarR family transcriptional regulator [Siccirubricoccus deserti]